MNHASSVCLLTGSEFDEFGKVSFETDHGKFAERSADSVIADMTLAKAGMLSCLLASVSLKRQSSFLSNFP